MSIKRGEIYLCALDPVIGKEIAKTRPVVIVSNNTGNKFSGTVTILPITSGNIDKIYPFEVRIEKGSGNLQKNSKVKAAQSFFPKDLFSNFYFQRSSSITID